LLLALPTWVAAQDDGLEQRYADQELSFGYPVGWLARATNDGVLVMPLPSDTVSDEPDVLMLTFVKPSDSAESMAAWPLDSDVVFLVGYITCEVVSGITEDGEHVEYGEIDTSDIDGKEFTSVAFKGQEMSGSVTAVEKDGRRLFAVVFGTTRTITEQESLIERIVQSVEFKG
jgi:hypothetical protein